MMMMNRQCLLLLLMNKIKSKRGNFNESVAGWRVGGGEQSPCQSSLPAPQNFQFFYDFSKKSRNPFNDVFQFINIFSNQNHLSLNFQVIKKLCSMPHLEFYSGYGSDWNIDLVAKCASFYRTDSLSIGEHGIQF